jgi:hypothetical protein
MVEQMEEEFVDYEGTQGGVVSESPLADAETSARVGVEKEIEAHEEGKEEHVKRGEEAPTFSVRDKVDLPSPADPTRDSHLSVSLSSSIDSSSLLIFSQPGSLSGLPTPAPMIPVSILICQ